jgi:hypothetical protein
MPAEAVLANADLRLEWANQHIQQFEREIQAFHARDNYRLIANVDPQFPHLVQLTDPPPIPPQLNLIASDAVYSMRVSLDYLACSLAVLNHGSMSNVYFPIAASVEEYAKLPTQRKIKKLSAEAKRFIHGLKPYKGGNNLLWAINEINKTDKHRNLVLFDEAIPMWYFTPRQDEEARDAVTQAPQYDYKVTLVPGFANLEGFERQSALTLLKEFLGSVADVLREARRLFFTGTSSVRVFS